MMKYVYLFREGKGSMKELLGGPNDQRGVTRAELIAHQQAQEEAELA